MQARSNTITHLYKKHRHGFPKHRNRNEKLQGPGSVVES